MIAATRLTMKYGTVVALKEATFTVSPREVVGLLGPNGAGKSTAMKILTTYLYPTGGTAQVAGLDILEHPLEVRKKIGYLPEVLPLYLDMEVKGYLRFVGESRGLHGARLRERTEWVVEKIGLKPMYRRVIRELSKGYKQRTALAQALIHDPEVIIIDEPTSGLDPHQIQEVRKLVRELAATKTVILSTHILQEAETIADRLLIISQGTIVGDGTLTQLRHRARNVEVSTFEVKASRAEVEKALAGISEAKRIECRGDADGYVRFCVEADPGRRLWRKLGNLARERQWELNELGEKPLSLEETFLALTQGEKGGAA